MPDLTAVTVPPLSRVADVELLQTGTWRISSGEATFTVEDLMAAVAALDCPAVRRPVLKLGHNDPRFDGQPAVGYVDNMRGSDAWRSLVGDYAGMPGWLGPIIASAYPDRSIEGEWGFRCQMGHTHDFVVTAVALLGVTRPGVGSLESLQDVGRLYGVEVPEQVAASAAQADDRHGGTRIRIKSQEAASMPNPNPRQVAASVSADDVRRAFYESPVGSDWDAWIEEIQLDPLQIIYIDDDEGVRYRVPVTVGGGDGPDAVSFGDPIKVVIRYEDAGSGMVAAAAGNEPIRFASRAESRPGQPPRAATQTPAEPPVTPTHTEEADDMSDTLSKGLRERLGVADDADEATILAAVDEALGERAEPTPPAAPVPPGHVVVNSDVLDELKVAAKAGQDARAQQLREDRDRTIAAAIKGGHIAPARREHWAKKWDADPDGVRASIAELTKDEPIFPVGDPEGYASTTEHVTNEDALYASLFGDEKAGV